MPYVYFIYFQKACQTGSLASAMIGILETKFSKRGERKNSSKFWKRNLFPVDSIFNWHLIRPDRAWRGRNVSSFFGAAFHNTSCVCVNSALLQDVFGEWCFLLFPLSPTRHQPAFLCTIFTSLIDFAFGPPKSSVANFWENDTTSVL